MKSLNGLTVGVLFILSIVIPVGLLATFRLTGILPEPEGPVVISETKTMEMVNLELETPDSIIDIDKFATSSYCDHGISLNSSILAMSYHDSSQYVSPYVDLIVNATAKVQDGFVSNLNVVFFEDHEESEVWINHVWVGGRSFEVWSRPKHLWPTFFQEGNLSLVDCAEYLSGMGNLEAFFELTGVNHPKDIHFKGSADWVFRHPINYTHQITLNFELIYYNGTAYTKIVLPFQLVIGPDDNDSFETADLVEEGVYSWLYLGGYDSDDYYKVYVPQGYAIDVHAEVTSDSIANFCLYLHNPERELKASTPKWNYSQTVTYVADSAGEWFIHTHNYAGYGFYALTVSIHPQGSD